MTHAEERDRPRFYRGMNMGFHGSVAQRESVKEQVISFLGYGYSVLIRGPFRVGKSTLLQFVADAFKARVTHLYAPDQADEFPKSGLIFLDEAGFLAPAFWDAIPQGLQICAVLPDSIAVPASWQGMTVRLDAFLKEQEWQPIETAPKDGTEFLGWCPDIGVRVLIWDEGRQDSPASARSGWLLAGTLAHEGHYYEPMLWAESPRQPE